MENMTQQYRLTKLLSFTPGLPHPVIRKMEPKIHTLFEMVTGTWQYVVADEKAEDAVIIDPVLDYDKETGKISTGSADKILDLVAKERYNISKILETLRMRTTSLFLDTFKACLQSAKWTMHARKSASVSESSKFKLQCPRFMTSPR